VIILFASYVEYAPPCTIFACMTTLWASAPIFFRDGVMIEGTWKRSATKAGRSSFQQWGLPMHLKPGNTWIVLTGDSSTFNEAEPGNWELRFDLP
jgi:hypothetical protein